MPNPEDTLWEALERIETEASGLTRSQVGVMWLHLDRIAGIARTALAAPAPPERCPECDPQMSEERPKRIGICFNPEPFYWEADDGSDTCPMCPIEPDLPEYEHRFYVAEAADQPHDDPKGRGDRG